MLKPFQGFGLGLRTDHFQEVLDTRPAVDWFEVISENFMVDGGKPKYFLHAIREHYPMAMHGVSLSIGSCDPLNLDYLSKLKTLSQEIEPLWISDHLCWTGVGGVNSHDLLPMPYNEEALNHLTERIAQVQDFLGCRILLENVSSYLDYQQSEMTEWAFFNELAKRADCLMLLDVNNIYVSARNHGFEPEQYLDGIDSGRIQQFHLAGHSDYGDYVVDTHDHDVPDSVWSLYVKAWEKFGPVSCMIERDSDIPPLSDLLSEMNYAKQLVTHNTAQACSEV